MREETKALFVTENAAAKRIAAYLESRMEDMETLESNIVDSGKSINECWKYIEFKARSLPRTGNCTAVDDEEVYGWAVHYYNEGGKPADMPEKKTVQNTAKPKTAKPAEKTEKLEEKQISFDSLFDKAEGETDEQIAFEDLFN